MFTSAGFFASLMNFYVEYDGPTKSICYMLSGIASSALLPSVLLLTASFHGTKAQPLRCAIWGSAAPLAYIVGEVDLYVGGKKHLTIGIQGLIFSSLALGISPLLMPLKTLSALWVPSNQRVRTVWTSQKRQVSCT